jgi:hypothetical protein
MFIYNYIKTDNPLIDTILTTVLFSIMAYLIQESNINCLCSVKKIFSWSFLYNIRNFFKTKNKICFQGKFLTSNNHETKTSSHCTTKFRAITSYIINNMHNFPAIKEISEMSCNYADYGFVNDAFMMVTQNNSFYIIDDIYIQTSIEQQVADNNNNNHNKGCIEYNKINIELYSYKHTVPYINEFVEKITRKYQLQLKDKRENKLFIYNLKKTKIKDDECKYNCWDEHEFHSNKTMDNLFLDNKDKLLQKIDFFINNQSWYKKLGIHYALGICLYGSPGTGKTSLIKAIANYTNRHIIVISLKLIKTKHDLESFFFEDRYNIFNEKTSIKFDNKIIVFEDIDCIGDIVKQREKSTDQYGNINNENLAHHKFNKINNKHEMDEVSSGMNDNKDNSLLKTLIDINNTNSTLDPKLLYEDPVTLDDILNLWDGIRETTGRILIMTSNHYNELDEALIRPGRIDINLELKKLSHSTLNEMYYSFFNCYLTTAELDKIQQHHYSPAEIINIYINYPNKDDFYQKLCQSNLKLL